MLVPMNTATPAARNRPYQRIVNTRTGYRRVLIACEARSTYAPNGDETVTYHPVGRVSDASAYLVYTVMERVLLGAIGMPCGDTSDRPWLPLRARGDGTIAKGGAPVSTLEAAIEALS